MSNIYLGLVGAGAIAEEHLKVIRNIKGVIVYGITSKTNKSAYKLAKKYKINAVYKNYHTMASDPKIDALLVLVSADQIFKVLNNIIPYRKTFFTEKPPGLNYNETKKLSINCKKYNTLNMVGLNRRFYSIFEKGIRIINKNGKLLSIAIEGHERYWLLKNNTTKSLIKKWHYANSIHTIDLIRFFGGEIKKINSSKSKGSKNYISTFEYKSGVIGTYNSSWHSPGSWSVKLYGNGVTVEFKPLEKGTALFKDFKIKKIDPDFEDAKFKPGFYKQMLYFKSLILNSTKIWPMQDINDSLKTMHLIKQISNDK